MVGVMASAVGVVMRMVLVRVELVVVMVVVMVAVVKETAVMERQERGSSFCGG